jgi:hypothetical protein
MQRPISFLLPLVLAAVWLVCGAHSHPLENRGTGSNFALYAYGDNISGLEVYYADGTGSLPQDSVEFSQS